MDERDLLVLEQAREPVDGGAVDRTRAHRTAEHEGDLLIGGDAQALARAGRPIAAGDAAAHRIAGDDGLLVREVAQRLLEADADLGREAGEQEVGLARLDVALVQEDAPAEQGCGEHARHRDVAAGRHHHLRAEAQDQDEAT